MSSESITFSSHIYNSKLYFSKYELNKILSCYALGVEKGYWKDYSINFRPNEASFSIYKNSLSLPVYSLVKYKLCKKTKFFYKLKESSSNNKHAKNFDELISFLKRKNLKIVK